MEYKTYAEYLRHPKFIEVRQKAMQMAGYTCRDCKLKKATEVHHIKYPPWGTFDVPENLVPVCHACHCKRHGVEN